MVESQMKKALAKVVLLGDVNVGKTSLINKFATGNAGQNSATVGTDFKTKTIVADGTSLTLQIWDTAGQEKHSSIGFAFYRGANSCILTFDVTNKASFQRLDFWKKNFIEQAAPQNPSQFPFIVCGNKVDSADRAVTREEAEAWCNANGGCPYMESSAQTGVGVEALFTATGKKALSQTKSEDDFMPASLGSAAGAIKIDRTTEAAAADDQKKKKKKCKC